MSQLSDSVACSPPSNAEYRCPGEAHSIDRATHLGRLASFYPPCRGCEFRSDLRLLSAVQQRQWAEIDRRAQVVPRFTGEALEGASAQVMDKAVVRQFSAALASHLHTSHPRHAAHTVLVAVDGHWATAELTAAACEALQWGGCRAVEMGAATTPALVAALEQLNGDAAIWIGNADESAHSLALKLWGSGGQPWSSPGELDAVSQLHATKIDRPRRRGGKRERAAVSSARPSGLDELYHGLRALRVVVETNREPWFAALCDLSRNSACRLVRRNSISTDSGHPVDNYATAARGAAPLARVQAQVIEHQAHLGLWVSGDGERCQVVDERGLVADPERLFLALATYLCPQPQGKFVAVERDASRSVLRALSERGWCVELADATRESMFDAIESHGAALGYGAQQRLWYGNRPGVADALWTVSLLLNLLSQSDRSLSEVLDAT